MSLVNAVKNCWQEAEMKSTPERVSSKGCGKGVGSGGRSVGIGGAVASDVVVLEDEVGVGVDDVLRLRLEEDCCRFAIRSCRGWR